jgi:ATP-binding cassette subfamily B protein
LAVAVLVCVTGGANLAGTYMIKPVVDAVGAGDWTRFVHLVALTAAIYAAGVAASVGYTQTMVRAAQRVVFDIRRDLLRHIETLPLSWFDRTRNGDVMSYFTNDVDTISEALNNGFANMVQAAIQTVGTIVLLVVLDWRLTLITLACDAIIVAYVRFSGRRSKRLFSQQQRTLGALDGYVEEMIAGQKVVKVFNHEGENLEGFRALNEDLRASGTGAQAYASTMVPATVAISYTNYAVVAVVGAALAIGGHMGVGSLASYLVFVRQAAMPINQLTQLGNFMLTALAGAERVFSVMEEPAEKDEGTVTLERIGAEGEAAEDGAADDGAPVAANAAASSTRRMAAGAAGWQWRRKDGTTVPLAGDVRFEDVTFGYDEGQTVLQNLSLFAKPGQKIAFVGSTGAGKTTITNLINRFYDVRSGKITYDGIDVRDIKKASLRSSLGIVLQDTHLFRGSIADNIRFGKLDATDEEVRHAARVANADSFISRLPHGYDTLVTADGDEPQPGAAAAHRHCPRGRERPAGAHPGRGNLERGHAHRGAHRTRNGCPHARPHGLCDCAPALHRAQRQRDHGA